MKKITLSIGMNDKDTKKQEIDDKKFIQVIQDNVIPLGGATIIPGCVGVYTHDDGQVVVEKSVQVVFYGADQEAVKETARRLCRLLNQESIAYEETEFISHFIGA